MRNPLSYYRVQKLISRFKRNVTFLNVPDPSKEYLDVGCGNNFNALFVHLDFHWMPGVDICWDFSKKRLPFSDNTFKGMFTEHCLEHIPYKSIPFVLREFYRTLKPGGTLRIIVPDGELYLSLYDRIRKGEKTSLPYQGPAETPIERVNGIFRNHGHQFIYDYETFKQLLESAGFAKVAKVSYRAGRDSNLLKDLEWRNVESLYLEAFKS